MTDVDLARSLAESHGPRLMVRAQMVVREASAAEDAVVDGVVAAAGRGGAPRDVGRTDDWVVAMVVGECRRQLRARGVFATTRPPVSPAADPMDALAPADREALVAGRDDRAALRRWREATVGLVLVRIPDPGCPGRSELIGGAAREDGGMLTARRLSALARHRETCHRCTEATTPVFAGLEDHPVIPGPSPLPGAVLTRITEAAADAERVAHVVERAGPYAADGFPALPRDPDPVVWLRRAVVFGALAAVLLLIALVVVGLTSG